MNARPSKRRPVVFLAVSLALLGSCHSETARGRYVPYISGEFSLVYTPPGSNYLNDHSLVRAPDGMWHLYGTTAASSASPIAEDEIAHAVAPALFGPWEAREPVLRARADAHEAVLWAPYVFELRKREWVMLYWGGWNTALPAKGHRGLRRALGEDLSSWRRLDSGVESTLLPGGRDPFVLRVGDEFFVYSVSVDDHGHGEIVMSAAKDLLGKTWPEPSTVLTDPVPSFAWGNLESPFIVPYGGQYYLFVTRTGPAPIDYVRTNVFRSSDPRHFEWRPITDLRAHAAEVVIDEGRYYLTSSGWTSSVGEQHRGLSIAPLAWAPEND